MEEQERCILEVVLVNKNDDEYPITMFIEAPRDIIESKEHPSKFLAKAAAKAAKNAGKTDDEIENMTWHEALVELDEEAWKGTGVSIQCPYAEMAIELGMDETFHGQI